MTAGLDDGGEFSCHGEIPGRTSVLWAVHDRGEEAVGGKVPVSIECSGECSDDFS